MSLASSILRLGIVALAEEGNGATATVQQLLPAAYIAMRVSSMQQSGTGA